jgi:enamine deaminase RidA (YjgF/YER057c/UK114 family)
MRRPLVPSRIRAPLAAYSHGVEVSDGARLLFTSGQLGIAPDGTIPESIEDQAILCFENLGAILAEAGMSFADVVRFNGYVTDRAYFPVYGAVRARYVSGSGFASTLLVVAGFTRPEFKIEVEITAARWD